MTQQNRDRPVALQKAKRGLITQREPAAEIGRSERHVRRLLKRLKTKGDAVIVHGLRGRQSNRKIDEKLKQPAIKILSDTVYSGFGPTLATKYLADKHDIHAGRETVRGWMTEGKLWRPKLQRIEKIHQWRQRRSRRRHQPDSRTFCAARFHRREHAFAVELPGGERTPLSFYTDKASLFQTAPKVARDRKALPPEE